MARSTSSSSSVASFFDFLLLFLPVDGCSVDMAIGGSAFSLVALLARFFFLLFFFLAGYKQYN